MKYETILLGLVIAIVLLNALTALALLLTARRVSLFREALTQETKELARVAEALQMLASDAEDLVKRRARLIQWQETEARQAALLHEQMLKASEGWRVLGEEVSQQIRRARELADHQDQSMHLCLRASEALRSVAPEFSAGVKRTAEFVEAQEQAVHTLVRTIEAFSYRLELMLKSQREALEAAPLRDPQAGYGSQRTLGDLVRFSAFAPAVVRRGTSFILSLWAYLEGQRSEVLLRASAKGKAEEAGTVGPIAVESGTELLVVIELAGFTIAHSSERLLWTGQIANTSFSILAGEGLREGTHPGCATVLLASVPLARVHFEIEIGNECGEPAMLRGGQTAIRSVFASYADEDRTDVLKWSRGAQDMGVDVFVDVLKLRNGDRWEQLLWREIPSRDMFCLFWSAPASKSAWVEKEWRCALATRGHDYIYPVALADPRDVPPPAELSKSKHFNDLTRIVIEYERSRREKVKLSPGAATTQSVEAAESDS